MQNFNKGKTSYAADFSNVLYLIAIVDVYKTKSQSCKKNALILKVVKWIFPGAKNIKAGSMN